MPETILVDDLNFTSLEIGAGCGNFGKTFHPECYLTDIDESLRTSCTNCQIDWFCDAYDLPWHENRFQNVILCNPYLYGFDDDENTEKIMDEILRVLDFNGGRILLLGHHTNKFCNPKRVEKRLNTYSQNKNINFTLNIEEINSDTEYVNYTFRQSIGEITKPNSRITIYVNP